jgi:membrane protein DedA with SNARE-associated domain
MRSNKSRPAKETNNESDRKHWSTKELIFGLLGLAITIVLCIIPLIYREELTGTGTSNVLIARWGLAGLAILAFIAASAFSLTAIPVPYWVLTLLLPSVFADRYGIWSPIWVALAAAGGATLGQFITYLIGYGGSSLSEKLTSRISPEFYKKAEGWMDKYGSWAIFIMSVTANPLHLPMTIAIAALRYPPYKFLIIGFIGQLVKSLVLAFAGYYGLTSLINLIGATGSIMLTLLIIVGVILAIAVWQLIVWMSAKKTNKQLLVIGGPWGAKPLRRWFNLPAHGGGDICLDIDRRAIEGHQCPVIASVTDIPFADKTFGAVFISHVLEHLPTVADAKKALEEMGRVSESVFVVYPSRQSIAAQLMKEHRLWVWQIGNFVHLQQRRIPGNRERIIVETTNKSI